MSYKELLHIPLDNGVNLVYRLSHPIDKSLPTIVMFHAFLMDSQFFNRQFADVRYTPYNLISIDAHGHGEATGRGEDFIFLDTASDSLQLLTKLNLNEFYVLRTTQGNFIALRMALLEPRRVKGLILLATTVYSATEQIKVNARKSRGTWCETEIPSYEAILARAAAFGDPARVDEKVYERLKQMWIKRYTGPEGFPGQ